MAILRSASPEIVALIEDFIDRHPFPLPEFSKLCRRDLAKLIGNPRCVTIVEAACTFGQYRDAQRYRDLQINVSKIHRRDKVKFPTGKRARPEMEAMVGDVAGLLLAFGMKEASGEYSKMVSALRLIASELNMTGDPRQELRRQIRIERRMQAVQNEVLHKLFREV